MRGGARPHRQHRRQLRDGRNRPLRLRRVHRRRKGTLRESRRRRPPLLQVGGRDRPLPHGAQARRAPLQGRQGPPELADPRGPQVPQEPPHRDDPPLRGRAHADGRHPSLRGARQDPERAAVIREALRLRMQGEAEQGVRGRVHHLLRRMLGMQGVHAAQADPRGGREGLERG